MDEVFDGVAVGGAGRWGSEGVGAGASSGLEGDKIVVVVAGDGSFGAGDDKAASGLGLDFPRISEGAPTRFEFRQTVGVPRDDDGMFVDLETEVLVNDCSDIKWATSPLEPSSEG